ncbi:unnamed protein product, partial [Adineta ricciae]
QHDYQDETNSNMDQYLFHEQFINNHRDDICDSSHDDQFYFRDNLERYSTVV